MPLESREKRNNPIMTGARLALILLLTGCSADSKNEDKTSDGSGEQVNQTEIDLCNTETSDISEYQGKTVTFASLSYNGIEDLSPLRGTPLEHLDIAFTIVKDLEALRGNTTLKEIDFRDTEISDLSPLSNAPLKMIFLNEKATDLSPIKNAIESGAKVFPPMGYRIDSDNWRLVKIQMN